MSEQGDGYTQVALQWVDFDISVKYALCWLSGPMSHIELHCHEPLPVTETGYKSIFLAKGVLKDEDEVLSFVSTLLNEAAQSDAWRQHLADRRQLKLF
jgi:hypothetical protein